MCDANGTPERNIVEVAVYVLFSIRQRVDKKLGTLGTVRHTWPARPRTMRDRRCLKFFRWVMEILLSLS